MIYILIYVVGCIAAYFLQRYTTKKLTDDWTKGDRVLSLVMSLLSIIDIVAALILLGVYTAEGKNEPAKW